MSGRPRRVVLVSAVALFAAGFLALVLIRSQEPLGLDQGLFACFARWIPRGWLPYRDLVDMKPPAELYTFALGFGVAGSTVSLWWFEAVWLGATFALLGVLVARRFGAWAGWAAAVFLLLGVWSPGFGGYWSRMQAEELSILPIVAAAFTALAAPARPRLAFVTGLLTGVAGLYKIPAISVTFAWSVTWIVATGWRQGLRRMLLMAAGLALPWTAVFVWFSLRGAAEDLVNGVFALSYYVSEASKLSWGRSLLETASRLGTDLGGVLGLAGVGLVALARRERVHFAWLASWIGISIATVVVQRQTFPYHFVFVAPSLAIAAGLGAVDLARRLAERRTRGLAAGFAAAALALLVWRIPAWHAAYAPSAALSFDPAHRATHLHHFDIGAFSPATEEELAHYLRDHTGPQDGLLIWGLAPGVYALADRHPITAHPLHKTLFTRSYIAQRMPGLAERRRDLVERMRRDPPAYFIVGQNDGNGFDPQPSPVSLLEFPQLAELVRREYTFDRRIGGFMLFRRSAP